ncbi:uncharacterized protein LOC119740366 [Patiria miniata]|uniref:Uncharacterized protein n=1 Tax=Patiria miniata TaxID=46514 RepID=A0A914B6H2_PATMI|nr:uncharacterized protein LOC119740366 [Patiria miniata]
MEDDRPVANQNNRDSEPIENGLDNNVNQNGHDAPDRAGSGSLRDFVSRNYHDQRVSGTAVEMSQADEERRNNFFQRAISESQRMSAEVDRCQQRHEALQAELGAGNLHAWTMEHASQVTVTLPSHSQSTIPELQEPMDE